MKMVEVNDKMQRGYRYDLIESPGGNLAENIEFK